jgi:hypothetical protein
MTLLRKLALVLLWAFLCTNYSNAQDSVTGNLITNPTFSNGSTGWTATGDGVAGMFAAGGVNAYNFSWQGGTVSQSIGISQALAGTGIVVKGLQYGWQYANWCKNQIGGQQSCFDPNGPVDPLSANVTLTNSVGTSVYSQNFNYNTWAYAWRWESQDVNFATSYSTKNLGNLNISFSGQDAGGWSGLYGPVVTNVYSRLKYGVDPCVENALSSPTCAGYFDALAKLAPKPVVADTTVAYTPPPEGPEPQPPTGAPPPPGNPPPNPNDPNPGAPPPTPGSTPPPATQQASAQGATSQQAQAGPAPAANSPQEKTGGGTPNLGFALSLVAKNSEREKAVTQQVVAQAESQAQAAGDRAQQVGTSTASAAVMASTTSAEIALTGTGIQASSSTTRATSMLASESHQASLTMLQNAQNFTNLSNTQQSSSAQLLSPVTIEQVQSTQNYSIFAVQQYRQQEAEQVTQQISFLTDLNNPLKQIIDSQQLQQTQQDQPQQAQRRETAPNELAIGVNLAQIAIVPQGYASYTNFILRDASFYEPKEVYKNQKVVDNIKVLRSLGSDQKHQDLVNLQYK